MNPEPDPRLQAIRERRAGQRAVRAEFAERRQYGIARRHAQKLNRNRQENTMPTTAQPNIIGVTTARPGLFATFKQEDGTLEQAPVVAWLLRAEGPRNHVIAAVVDNDTGALTPVDSASNFAGLEQ